MNLLRFAPESTVGIAQPTFQSATFGGGRVSLIQMIDGKDNSDDGPVPRVSATSLELSADHRENAAEQ